MSQRGRSIYQARSIQFVQPEVTWPIVPKQFSHEPPEVEPPTLRQDPFTPAQERKDEGASAAQRPELEADGQELVQTKTGYERGDGPDVKGMCLPNPEPGKLPESEKQSALKDTLK
uniref:GAGE domain-containing protein n=1 Tax=Theropithecus gelada TaxID=9565 RepID=A0A8D2G457_THEGE